MIQKDGFDFAFDPQACKSCMGNCCIGDSGYVWVTKDEGREIANFLDMEFDEFKKNHLRKIRFRFSLKEYVYKNEYICEFFDLDKRVCRIYDVRPLQCRTFPFWNYFKENIKEVKEECPGIIHF